MNSARTSSGHFWDLLNVQELTAGQQEKVEEGVTAQGLGSPAIMPAEKGEPKTTHLLPAQERKKERKQDASPFGARPVSDH